MGGKNTKKYYPHPFFFETPTTKAVGLYFTTNSEPTALVVGVGISDKLNP